MATGHPQTTPRGLVAHEQVNIAGIPVKRVTALPGNDADRKLVLIVNSTGQMAVGVNTTGTTWKYLNTTADLPT